MKYRKNGILHDFDVIQGMSAYQSAVIGGYDKSEEEFYKELSDLATNKKVEEVKEEIEGEVGQLSEEIADLKENGVGVLDEKISLSMFQNIGVIGDSFASGEIYPDNIDYYELSWGQVLARSIGAKCTNYSKGGLTSQTWLTDEKGLTQLQNDEAKQLYIIALGINDTNRLGINYIGSTSDINLTDYTQNANSFYGNIGKIIQIIKRKNAKSKIVLSTLMRFGGNYDVFSNAVIGIAEFFDIPYINPSENPYFKSDYFKDNQISNHPTAPNYACMAKAIRGMLSDVVYDNYDYFKDYTLIYKDTIVNDEISKIKLSASDGYITLMYGAKILGKVKIEGGITDDTPTGEVINFDLLKGKMFTSSGLINNTQRACSMPILTHIPNGKTLNVEWNCDNTNLYYGAVIYNYDYDIADSYNTVDDLSRLTEVSTGWSNVNFSYVASNDTTYVFFAFKKNSGNITDEDLETIKNSIVAKII